MIYLTLMQEDVEYLRNLAARRILKIKQEVQRVYNSKVPADTNYLNILGKDIERTQRIYDMCNASIIAKAAPETVEPTLPQVKA